MMTIQVEPNDEYFMRRAIALAAKAEEEGENLFPFTLFYL